MSREILTVATVEDEPDTVWDYIAELRVAGLKVLRAADTSQAEALARSEIADLWLVDLRLPSGARMSFTGGVEFIQRIRSGEFGSQNQGAYFAVVTAHISDICEDDLADVPGFVGVYSKMLQTSDFIALLQRRIGQEFVSHRGESTNGFWVDDLVLIDASIDEESKVSITVPAWPHSDQVRVPLEILPSAVAQELEFSLGVRPIVYAWALVNIAAGTADEVMPREFRLYEESPEDEDAFTHSLP